VSALARLLRRLADRIDPMRPVPALRSQNLNMGISHLEKRLAPALRSWLARLDPPAPAQVAPIILTTNDPDPDGRFVDDLILRDTMFRALNRYSPRRLPAQA
jgi:hypothetical protein